MKLEEKLKELVIKNTSNCEINFSVDSNTRLVEDLKYDSVDLVSLIVDIEDEFSIQFDDVELLTENMQTLGQLVGLVNSIINKCSICKR